MEKPALVSDAFTVACVRSTSSWTSYALPAFGGGPNMEKLGMAAPGAMLNCMPVPGTAGAAPKVTRKYRAVTGANDSVDWTNPVCDRCATSFQVAPSSLLSNASPGLLPPGPDAATVAPSICVGSAYWNSIQGASLSAGSAGPLVKSPSERELTSMSPALDVTFAST